MHQVVSLEYLLQISNFRYHLLVASGIKNDRCWRYAGGLFDCIITNPIKTIINRMLYRCHQTDGDRYSAHEKTTTFKTKFYNIETPVATGKASKLKPPRHQRRRQRPARRLRQNRPLVDRSELIWLKVMRRLQFLLLLK